MGILYPSARVRLVLRFDEGATFQDIADRVENETENNQANSFSVVSTSFDRDNDLAQLFAERDSLSDGEFQHRLSDIRRRREDSESGGLPAAFGASSDDGLTVIGNVLPMSVDFSRNGLRLADSATITIAHEDAPFDPRAVRSAAIEITIGTVDAESYARGMRGERRPDGSMFSVVPRAPISSNELPGTTRFIGYVDEWKVDFKDDNIVELQCRDLSAVPMDQKLPPGIGLDMSLPIDEAISSLFDIFPSMRGTVVRWAGDGDAPSLSGAMPTSRMTRRGRIARRSRSGGENMTVWDHIVESCVQVGVIPSFVDTRLDIIEPRTFFSGGEARVMIWGRNLSSLSFTRKMGGTKVPTIEVRAYDPGIGRTRWSRFPVPGDSPSSGVFGVTDPPRAARAANVTPSGVAMDKIVTFTIQVVTPDAMMRAAEALWHEIGRKEIEGSMETMDISSWVRSSDFSEPIVARPARLGDLLTMRSGDAIEILTARLLGSNETQNSTVQLATMSTTARRDYLVSLGWDADVAARFAQLQAATAEQTVFRVQSVDVSFGEDGLRIGCDFINFLEVREDV